MGDNLTEHTRTKHNFLPIFPDTEAAADSESREIKVSAGYKLVQGLQKCEACLIVRGRH